MEYTPQELARGLLEWYRAAGVDAALGEEAIDWLARGEVAPGHGFSIETAGRPELAATGAVPQVAPLAAQHVDVRDRKELASPAPKPASRAPSQPQAPANTRLFPTATPDEAVTTARAAAAAAGDLDALAAALQAFNGCALKATAKNLCFYRGARQARLLIIGEAPGRDEDLEGRPFIGRAGQLLDKMLAAVGLGEDDVHITNTVYWRPPGNRTPSPQEMLVCRPFLERQIALVEPEFIGLFGGAAANAMLGVPDGIMKLRGKWRDIEIGARKVKVMPTLHPAYLLRTPAHKRLAWRDLLELSAALDRG